MGLNKTDRFDFSQLLDFRVAQIQQSTHAGQYPDDQVELLFTLPYGAAQEAKDWIYENRHVVQDVELPTKLLKGVWRTVSVSTRPIQDRNGVNGHQLVWVLAEGFYKEIDWESARLFSDKQTLGNAVSVPSVPQATTNDPGLDLLIEFPYCDPRHITLMIQSLRNSHNTNADIVVRGQTYQAPWHLIAAQTRRENDGTHTIVARYSRSKYVLKGYRDSQTSVATLQYYVWNVPKEVAQQIIDDWKASAGPTATATASYHENQELVDLVLALRDPAAKENLTTAPIITSCTSHVVFHFAWGYTKAELDLFYQSHSGPLGPGWIRRINEPRQRGDGLYDAVIEEYKSDPVVYSVFATRGERGSGGYLERGWDVSEAMLDAVKAIAETQEERKAKTLEYKRNDNCSYDYEYREDVRVLDQFEVLAPQSNNGYTVKHCYRWGLTLAELNALKATLEAASALKEVDIVAVNNRENNDTFDVLWREVNNIDVHVALHTSTTVFPNYNIPNIVWGYNRASLPSPPSGWAWASINIQIRPTGRIDYTGQLVNVSSQLDVASALNVRNVTRTSVSQYTLGENVLSIPATPSELTADLNSEDYITSVEINPSNGLLRYRMEKTQWRVPVSWAAEQVEYREVTYQKRDRVIGQVHYPVSKKKRVYIQPEKRKIEKTVKAWYSTQRMSASSIGPDDFIAEVKQLGPNLWKHEYTSVNIGRWENDGFMRWIDIDYE